MFRDQDGEAVVQPPGQDGDVTQVPSPAGAAMAIAKGDADALFFTTVALLAALVGVVVYAKMTSMVRMQRCVPDVSGMQVPDEKEVYRKISSLQPAMTLTRDTAAILIATIVATTYSYINYLHTGYQGDLISALSPLTVPGLMATFHWPVTSFSHRRWAGPVCALSGALFTITVLYTVSCVRGHFDHPGKYVWALSLLIVAALGFILANVLEGFKVVSASKEMVQVNGRTLVGRMIQTLRRRAPSLVTSTMTELKLDTRTYMVIGVYDILIVSACALAFAIPYTIHVSRKLSNWQLCYIPLILCPFVFWINQLVHLVSAAGSRPHVGRGVFNLIITTFCVVTFLIFMLSAYGVFSTKHYTWLVAIPTYTVVSLFVISVAVSSPMVVPILTIDCADDDSDQCVEMSTHPLSGEVETRVLKAEGRRPGMP